MANLISRIHAGILINEPVLVWGTPGVGKTKTIERLAKRAKVHLETFISSQHEAVDVSGVHYVDESQIKISKPFLIEKLNSQKQAWLFLDELFSSARQTQNALMRLILEREISGYILNDSVRVIAASNFTDVAGNILPSTAMANRFVHIFHKPSIEEWIEAESDSDQVGFTPDDNWEKEIPYYKSLVFSFVETYREYFNTTPDMIEKPEDCAFCTPRSLTTTAKILALTVNHPDLTKELCIGTIGAEPARKLITFIHSQNRLQSFKNIDLNKFTFPDDPTQVMVLMKSAALYAEQKEYSEKAIKIFNMAYDAGNRPAAMKYAKILAKNLTSHMNGLEILKAIPFVQDAISARKS
jgi:hypothetical protein